MSTYSHTYHSIRVAPLELGLCIYCSFTMPKELALRFMVMSGDQDPANRSFKRTVRSHAASVSRSQRSNRRPIRTRYEGEGVILFDAALVNSTAGHDPPIQPAAACTDQSTVFLATRQPSEPPQSISDSRSDPGQEQSNTNTSQPQSLCVLQRDYLSGNDFSPLQHLATYHAPYLPGVLNHYIYNLTIPIPELDGSSTVPLFRAAWLPVVLNDPVVFQVIILFAATHYASIAHPSQYGKLRLELLTLKQSALLALIEAVQGEQSNDLPPSDTDQSCDSRDALIAGAAKMAAYEAIFGSKEAVSPFVLCKILLCICVMMFSQKLTALSSSTYTCPLSDGCFVLMEGPIFSA